MGHDDDAPSNDVEFLDVGPERESRGGAGARQSWPRWVPLLAVGVLAAAVIAIVVQHNGKPSASASHPPTTLSSPHSAASTAPAPGGLPAPVVVTSIGHRLLGVTAGWELFARGDGVVVRIQFARGRVTRTTTPALGTSGPVSFVVGASRAIVRPIDYVPGYVVPDGRPARQASGILDQGGPIFPGPDLDHIWVQSVGSSPPALTLVPLGGGGRAGPVLPMPTDGSALAAYPDGAGYLLFTGTGGVYDARPSGLHRITTGAVLAVGPTGWLTLECDSQARCDRVLIDRTDGSRRILGAVLAATAGARGGLIAPDGSVAATVETGANGRLTLDLLDLHTGRSQPLRVPVDPSGDPGAIAWSPDSRWLFALGASGGLNVIDTRTGHLVTLGTPLPKLSQLAIRPATSNRR